MGENTGCSVEGRDTTVPVSTSLKFSAPNRMGAVFLVLFAATYLILYSCYAVTPDAVLRNDVYYYTIVYPAKTAINWLAPGEQVVGVQNRLQSMHSNLNIVRGCDGSGVAFLLIAAIVAYRARIRATLLGVAGAVMLTCALNQARIVVLYFIDSYRPAWFTAVHVYFTPTLMILAAMIYFAVWTANREHDIARSAPEVPCHRSIPTWSSW